MIQTLLTSLDGRGSTSHIGVWVVMMAGMMLPSRAPTTAVYATLTRRHELSRSLLFAVGYLLVWSGAGVAVYWLCAPGMSLFASDLAWHLGGG